MKIFVNGKAVEVETNSKVCDILSGYDVFVRNGYGIDKNSLLAEGDKIIAVKKGEIPDEDNLKDMILSRNGEVSKRLESACVCICGLGGLGSNIAQMLARLGVGSLILADFDVVDPTNLNRQNYYMDDIGSLKTDATARILKKINPYINIVKKNVFVCEENILNIVQDADVVVEAFDNPKSKALLVNILLEQTEKYVVASSGMAGYGSSNMIRTSNPLKRLYLCGDNTSEAAESVSLMAPLVSVCAGHQANAVLRILLGQFEI